VRIAFLGTPAFAVPTLEALCEAGHDVAAVYTRAPKPAGRRGLDLTPSPVHACANARGLPVLTPPTLRDDIAVDSFVALGVRLGVVVGYGVILPPTILSVPPHGFLNLHPSLLPRWRGAAPIQRPIMAGDTETAAAVMKMEEGLDTGPVALEARVPIQPDATAGEMHDRLAAIGARLIVEAIAQLDAGTLRLRPQSPEGVVYAPKIDKAEARIDWALPATQVHNLIRGLSPVPGAFFETDLGRGPERIKVLRATRVPGDGPPGTLLDDALAVACGGGAVRLAEVQRAGKAPMTADVFLRGTPLAAGTKI
jgi:methionyl-tRNA formyltransferase